jgi:hypothetical protein
MNFCSLLWAAGFYCMYKTPLHKVTGFGYRYKTPLLQAAAFH